MSVKRKFVEGDMTDLRRLSGIDNHSTWRLNEGEALGREVAAFIDESKGALADVTDLLETLASDAEKYGLVGVADQVLKAQTALGAVAGKLNHHKRSL